MGNLKLPHTFIDVKAMIDACIEGSHKISVKRYDTLFSNQGEVTHFNIETVEDEEGYANLELQLIYQTPHISQNGLTTINKTKKLRVLNSQGDSRWTNRMQNLIWDGDYPSTVAVDILRGEVFLFNITSENRLELVEFGFLDESQFDAFKTELSDREPFSIKLTEDAMFDYIDGAEGLNHLKRNVVIDFNSSIPIRVVNKFASSDAL